MPEATINEYRNLTTREDKVRPARHGGDGSTVDEEAKAPAVELLADSELGSRISFPLAGEPLAGCD